MPVGFDRGTGVEPGVVRRVITSPKDPALVAAREAGLQVMEGRYTVFKYHGDVEDGNLYEIVETAPNLFLTTGINTVLLLAVGQAATAYSGSNARLCVGDGTTAATAADTDLVGTNKFRQLVSGAPSVTTNQVLFSATFGTSVANFDWREVGVSNAAAAGQMWSRTVINLGTKVSSASWVLNWTLAIN